jgi:hypothetical protein
MRSCSRRCKCGGSCVGIARRSRKVLAAAHGGARVASEGLDPHSHLSPVFVGGGEGGVDGPRSLPIRAGPNMGPARRRLSPSPPIPPEL